jgi:excisionase family DNA binding protein
MTQQDVKLIPLLLNTRDAARALSISERLLWTKTNSREIPCVRIGKRVLYSPADLEAWIQQQKKKMNR